MTQLEILWRSLSVCHFYLTPKSSYSFALPTRRNLTSSDQSWPVLTSPDQSWTVQAGPVLVPRAVPIYRSSLKTKPSTYSRGLNRVYHYFSFGIREFWLKIILSVSHNFEKINSLLDFCLIIFCYCFELCLELVRF